MSWVYFSSETNETTDFSRKKKATQRTERALEQLMMKTEEKVYHPDTWEKEESKYNT